MEILQTFLTPPMKYQKGLLSKRDYLLFVGESQSSLLGRGRKTRSLAHQVCVSVVCVWLWLFLQIEQPPLKLLATRFLFLLFSACGLCGKSPDYLTER